MSVAALLGGLGLFLLGMSMMTEGLKLAAGDALRTILDRWTRSGLRGLLAGILVTAIVQSSSAVTVATVGFVNAGLLTLSQSVWVVFGANVGTTMTGWLVAAIGIKVDVGALALPLLGIGMMLRLAAGSRLRRGGVGQAIAGFGAFFLGVSILQEGFAALAPQFAAWTPPGALAIPAAVLLGIVLTLLTQSSSAAIAIALTASAGGALSLELGAATVIGTSIGTTSTALFAAIGATAPAKRTATAHIVFSLLSGGMALILLFPLLRVSTAAAGAFGATDLPTSLAAFHTLFKCLGVAVIWPLTPRLVALLSRMYRQGDEEAGRPRHLDQTLVAIPALALRGLVLEVGHMMRLAFRVAALRAEARPGTPAEEAAAGEAAVLSLGRAIREFVGRLSAQPLPQDVIVALPDMLRAVQHLEEVARESRAIGSPPPGWAPGAHDAVPGRADLQAALADSLYAPVPAAPQKAEPGAEAGTAVPEGGTAEGPTEPDSADRLGALAARTESAYAGIKAGLLAAAAMGEMTVARMEAELLHAQSLRRTAEAARKARRRLLPWLTPMPHGATPTAAGEDAEAHGPPADPPAGAPAAPVLPPATAGAGTGSAMG